MPIIRAILEELKSDNDWSAKKSLAACCLVSRSFLPLAREQLYRRVPHLASFLVHLTFSFTSTENGSLSSTELSNYQEELASLLVACSRLISLEFFLPRLTSPPPMATALKQALEGLGSRLKVLSIPEAYWCDGTKDVLEAQVALKSLSVDLSDYWPQKQLRRPSFQLQHFSSRYSSHADVDWKAVGKLLKASRSTLSVLRLETAHLPSGSVDDLNLARYVALRSLNLTCYLYDNEQIQEVLELISMPFVPFSNTYLLDVLLDTHSLPNLKILGLDHRSQAEDGWEAPPRPLKELDTISEAGEKRGIVVYWVRGKG
ncbi:hypothetical protein BCR35DRAFT_333991 [Leucosporidium creatinivorum]|uniref:F-box domain-containing protein n=1 Tax=Leucosporidium creatinivorum TaxID=106004 RepID=A0A1Y2EM02_9BASI|nr:hypothetical protein BCR35DRAFT_333991 [Leucosporidium creatinivorum]